VCRSARCGSDAAAHTGSRSPYIAPDALLRREMRAEVDRSDGDAHDEARAGARREASDAIGFSDLRARIAARFYI